MKRFPLRSVLTAGVILFLYLPIVMLVISSFNDSRFGGVWTGFTLKWYARLWQESAVWHALANSFIIALSATVTSTILGSMAALALHFYKTKLQKVHYGLIYTPLVIPDILMGMSLLLFFVVISIRLSLFTVYIAHTTFCISYVTMVMLAKLQNFDFSVLEAAQDLGAGSWTIVRRVLVPLLAPGLAAAALLAFTLSIDDFVITFFVAGQGATTLPLYIYSMIKFGSTPIINALSTVILLVTFLIVGIVHTLVKELGHE